MAPRPSWRGYLKLSLVTCPVAMLPATSEAEKVRFHTLNHATGNRVHARYVDAETGKPVDDEDQVKGYEREDGEYVMLEDEELDAVALESTRTIDIDCFAPFSMPSWPATRSESPALAFSMWRRGPHARGGIHKPERPSRSQPARQCGSTQARPSKMPSIRRLRRRLPGRSLHHQRNPRCGSKLPLDARSV
jgi:hypothetical protein